MISNIVVDPEGGPNPESLEMFKGQAMTFTLDANMWAVREGGSLSSAVWSVESDGVTVGSDSETSNVSTALITASSEGESRVKVLMTLDDGQIWPQWIYIFVREMNRVQTRYWS